MSHNILIGAAWAFLAWVLICGLDLMDRDWARTRADIVEVIGGLALFLAIGAAIGLLRS